MTPQEVQSQRESLQLLDVREPFEWAAGHVAGSVHIPMEQVPARLGELDRGTPVAVICRSGNRSAAVTDYLQRAGFEAHNVEGGLQQWAAEGLPVQ